MGKAALACGAGLALTIAIAASAEAASHGGYRTISAQWQAPRTADWHQARHYHGRYFVAHPLGPGPYPTGPGPAYRAAPFPFFPYFGYGWAW